MALPMIAARMASATLLGALAFGASGVGTASAAVATHHASIDISSSPAAAAQVGPGGTFTDTFVISDQGNQGASDLALQFTYDPALVQLQGVQFNRAGSWVTSTSSNGFHAALGTLNGSGDSATMTATFMALPAYQSGAPLQAQLDTSWRDSSSASTHHTTISTPLVAGGSATSGVVVAPSTSGLVQVSAAGFQPSEAVTFWYNLPNGTAAPLYLRDSQLVTDKSHAARNPAEAHVTINNASVLDADASGNISTSFPSTGLMPGAYSIVAHGLTSGISIVIPFMS